MNRTLFDITTECAEQTEAAGKRLAELLMDKENGLPLFLALYGDLGVGKTAFTRGIAQEISPGAAVRSPTFALVNQYKNDKIPFYHFDMYRIIDEDDLYSTGFYDYLSACERGRAVCVVEWSENIPYAIPEDHLKITISKTDKGECTRRILAEHIS